MMINVKRFSSVTKMNGYVVDDWKLTGGGGRGGCQVHPSVPPMGIINLSLKVPEFETGHDKNA
jgi:hypothetical protein